jgi:hypothetical protein
MDNLELKDFVIEDTPKAINEQTINEANIAYSTGELEQFDFSSEKEFDVEQYHELISFMKKETEDESVKELIKLQEAKNIIEKDSKRFLDPAFVDKYNQEEQNLVNMIKKFDPNLDFVQKMTEEQKDKIYEIAQYLFNVYQKKLNELVFHFPLTDSERKFVYNVFRNKLEYDQNEVFQLKEIKENYLDKDFKKNDKGDFDTYINVNDLIIFYHLISKYKVKGITQEHYDYLQVLTKIGERIKLFNAYNVVVQRLSNDFQLWGGALSVELGEVTGNVLEPTKTGESSAVPTDSSEIHLVNEETGEVIINR